MNKSIKIAILGFLVVFVASLLSMKPYLVKAVYHNFATIHDYRKFENRVVKAAAGGIPWEVAQQKFQEPTPETQQLLDSLKTTALLMIENRKIVYEKYFLDGGAQELSGSFSMAKTLVSLLMGFALQEQFIRSLDEPVSQYLPEWSERKEGKITLKNLLTMNSGLNWNESYWNPFALTAEAYYGSNLNFTVLRLFEKNQPRHFYYSSGDTQLLGLIIARATNRHLADYFSQKLWIPLGAEKDALWSLDHEEGMEKAFCCFNSTARDFAKIGQFLLNSGSVVGPDGSSKVLLNAAYLKDMIQSNLIPDENGKPIDYYGYQIWLIKTERGDAFYARGILGQYIVVIPSRNRVVVRLGKATGDRIDHHPVELRALIDWALN